MKLIVIKKFRDKNNRNKVYSQGDEVVHFEEERAEDVIKRGLAKKAEESQKDEGKNPHPESVINLGAHWRTVVSDVKNASDVGKLKEALAAEKTSAEPRDSVLKAIEERITELESF